MFKSRDVLVLNAGSSSLKFSVFQHQPDGDWSLNIRGQIAGWGASPRLTASDASGRILADDPLDSFAADRSHALNFLTTWLRTKCSESQIIGVGHRVVHGGRSFHQPVMITPAVMDELRSMIPLAPLHQPLNLEPIEAIQSLWPDVPQVACFDTAFHRDRSQVTRVVPMPAELRNLGLERYGFHGLSYEYVASALPSIDASAARGRVIVAHLGNGASLCALRNGRSVDTTMGFTALDGLCMGTRPGALDPGIVLYLIQHLKMTANDVEELLYRKSGLLGLSGMSPDMRDLLHREDPDAQLAVDYFVYRAAREIGAMTAILGGLDALVFTAGIGENSAVIRHKICEASAWLGLELDETANSLHQSRISSPRSSVSVFVIPTNEELMIARHTRVVLGL